MDEVNLISGGDINAIAEQGNESAVTSLKHYIELKKRSQENVMLTNWEEPGY